MIIQLRQWQESFGAALLLSLELLEREQPGLLVVVGREPLGNSRLLALPRRRADNVVGAPLVSVVVVVQGQQPPLLTRRTTVLGRVSYSLAAVLWHSFFGRDLVVQHRGLVTGHRRRSIIARLDLPRRCQRRGRAACARRRARRCHCVVAAAAAAAVAAAVPTIGIVGRGCAREGGRRGRRRGFWLHRVFRAVQFSLYDMFEERVHLTYCERRAVSHGELVDLHVLDQLLGGVSSLQHRQLLGHVAVDELVEPFVIVLAMLLLVLRLFPLLAVRLAFLLRVLSILLLVPAHRFVVESHDPLELSLQLDELPLVSNLELGTTPAGIVPPRLGQIHVEEVLAHGVQKIVHAAVGGIVGLPGVDPLQLAIDDLQEVDHLLLAKTRSVPMARMLLPRQSCLRAVVVTAGIPVLPLDPVLRVLLALVHLQVQQLLADLAEELDELPETEDSIRLPQICQQRQLFQISLRKIFSFWFNRNFNDDVFPAILPRPKHTRLDN